MMQARAKDFREGQFYPAASTITSGFLCLGHSRSKAVTIPATWREYLASSGLFRLQHMGVPQRIWRLNAKAA